MVTCVSVTWCCQMDIKNVLWYILFLCFNDVMLTPGSVRSQGTHSHAGTGSSPVAAHLWNRFDQQVPR